MRCKNCRRTHTERRFFPPLPQATLPGRYARQVNAMAIDAKEMTPAFWPIFLQLLTLPLLLLLPRWPTGIFRSLLSRGTLLSAMPSRRRLRPRLREKKHVMLLSALLLGLCGGHEAVAPSPVLAYVVGCPLRCLGMLAGGHSARCGVAPRVGDLRAPCLVRRERESTTVVTPTRRGVACMAAAGDKEEEKMELAAEVWSFSNKSTNTRQVVLMLHVPHFTIVYSNPNLLVLPVCHGPQGAHARPARHVSARSKG